MSDNLNLSDGLSQWRDEAAGGLSSLPPSQGGSSVKVVSDTIQMNPTLQRVVSVPPWKKFPVELLPGDWGTFVRETAAAIGCDPSLVAIPLLPVAGAAIGNSRRIYLKNAWSEPPVVWSATVSDSGTQKSPAHYAVIAPVQHLQKLAIADHRQACAQYRIEDEKYRAMRTHWKKDQIYTKTPPEPPTKPVCVRYLVEDTTIEALAERLLGRSRGLLLVQDEFDGWLKSFDQYRNGKGGDLAKWLSIHAARPMTVDRKTGNKEVFVPAAFVSLTGGIQPGTLRRSFSAQQFENGMVARILYAMPPKRRKRWTDVDVDPGLVERYAQLVNYLYQLPLVENETGPVPEFVKLNNGAKEVWIEFYNRHAGEQVELTANLSAAWSKLEGYAARFTLIIHYMRLACGGSSTGNPLLIDEASVHAGCAMSDWFGQEAKRVYAMLSETDDQQQLRENMEHLDRLGGVVTAREWQRARSFLRSEDAEMSLRGLESLGVVVSEKAPTTPRGGCPTTRYRLRPGLLMHPDSDTTQVFLRDTGVVSEPSRENESDDGGAP